MFDQWTTVHLLAGCAAGLLGMKLSTTFATGLVVEGAEQVFQRTDFGKRFFNISGPEVWRNVVGDMLALTAGWLVVYLARRR